MNQGFQECCVRDDFTVGGRQAGKNLRGNSCGLGNFAQWNTPAQRVLFLDEKLTEAELEHTLQTLYGHPVDFTVTQ